MQKISKTIRSKYLLWKSSLIITSISISIFAYTMSILIFQLPNSVSLLISILTLAFYFLINQYHKKDLNYFIHVLHQRYPEFEYSLSLFFKNDINRIENIQKQKISERFLNISKKIKDHVKHYSFSFLLILLTIVINMQFNIKFKTTTKSHKKNDVHNFVLNPEINVKLTVIPPKYTKHKQFSSSTTTINAPEFSRIKWLLESKPGNFVDIRFFNSDTIGLSGKSNYELKLKNSLYFSFYYGNEQSKKESDLYRIKMIEDSEAQVEILLKRSNYDIDPSIKNSFTFRNTYSDDYGLNNLKIIATLGKGKGESIKFREQSFTFKNFDRSNLSDTLEFTLNFSELGAGHGDELYFYLEATDNRPFAANKSRSDTYFLSLKDTNTQEFTFEGGLAIERLPEYFMSQRKIIIETEKLVKRRKNLHINSLLMKSNDLAHHQKLLRRRYGTFLGEEFLDEIDHEALEKYHEESGEEVESHFVGDGHDHGEENKINSSKDLNTNEVLESFIHDHDSEEQAEYFDPKIKSKLKSALREMWSAELHLRLSQPELALPFEYKALKLIKEVQQDSRIYVERIGFEAPKINIKESRLRGDFEEKFKIKNQYNRNPDNTEMIIEKSLEILNHYEKNTSLPPKNYQKLKELERFILEKHPQYAFEIITGIRKIYNKNLSTDDLNKLYKLLTVIQKPDFYPTILKDLPGSKLIDALKKELE